MNQDLLKIGLSQIAPVWLNKIETAEKLARIYSLMEALVLRHQTGTG